MDINIIGRNLGITDRFREYATEKSEKVSHLAERAISFEIKISRHNEKLGSQNGDDRVELTLVGPKAVVRSEATGQDKYAAFDIALGKLLERVRRAKDRRKVHRGQHRPTSLREASTDGFSSVGLAAAPVAVLDQVRTGSTPAVSDELTFIADTGRKVHCLDTKTGQPFWTHEAAGDFWASPLLADGKVYIGTRKGNFLVFAASREKKLLAEINLPRPISATATAANGTLYVATMDRIYALQAGARSEPAK